MIAGDFNHLLRKQDLEGDWGATAEQHGVSFAIHDGEVSIFEVAHRRFQQAPPDSKAEEEALSIRRCITYHALGQEIDRICSMVPTCAARSGSAGSSPPPPALACTEAAATYVAKHAGFDHGPRLAKFTLWAPPGGPAGCNMPGGR